MRDRVHRGRGERTVASSRGQPRLHGAQPGPRSLRRTDDGLRASSRCLGSTRRLKAARRNRSLRGCSGMSPDKARDESARIRDSLVPDVTLIALSEQARDAFVEEEIANYADSKCAMRVGRVTTP